ncbi:hypothetical protein S245_068065, partial [Arachis hypogaea]
KGKEKASTVTIRESVEAWEAAVDGVVTIGGGWVTSASTPDGSTSDSRFRLKEKQIIKY